MVKASKFFIPYIVLLFILGFKGEIVISFFMVFLHEIVHYLTARFFGYSGFDIEFNPTGGVLKLKEIDEATAEQDLVISISGPLFNLILAGICYISSLYMDIFWLKNLILVNLTIGIFNLIPALPLDGARILKDIFRRRMPFKKANEYTIKISLIIGYIMMSLYFILFFRNIENISLGVVTVFVIVISIGEKDKLAYLIMGDIVKKKSKFLKRGYIENKSISIHVKSDLLDAIGLVDKNKHSIFLVLDDEMNLVDIFYEGELIEGLKNYGNIKVGEFINKL